MPWIESLSDAGQLRQCIRDLVALSVLPALWAGLEPSQMAGSIAAALVAILDAEFVCLSPDGSGQDLVLETASELRTEPRAAELIGKAVRDWLPGALPAGGSEVPNPIGGGTVTVASAAIGIGNQGVLIAASRRSGFPTETQRLYLAMGANEVAVALYRWRLERDERRFAVLVENSSDFIGIASLDGMPQYINPAGLKRVGLEGMEQARRTHILEFLLPEEREHGRRLWPAVMQVGRWAGELNFSHFKTGVEIPFLVEWFRIDDPRNGKPMNLAILGRDLTLQRRSQLELRRLNETLERRVSERTAELADVNARLLAEVVRRQKADARLQEIQLELIHAARLSAAGQMTVALAHELNQPLTAAANFANAARRRLATSEPEISDAIRDDVDEAVGQILRAGQIIRRLRDFASRGETERRLENVEKLVEEASSLALTRAQAAGVEIRYRFDPKTPYVFADRIQIQQVLINLMRNAVEAMANCSPRELTVTTAALGNNLIEIAVVDSGPGLPGEISKSIFKPFVSTKPSGMGLGLSICRSIVEAHGGKIRFVTRPGGGTTFYFTLSAGAVTGVGDVD